MLKDATVWKSSAFYFVAYTGVYGLSFWIPTIIKSLSETATTNLEIGWLAMLPYLVAIPSLLIVGWSADRIGKHKLHLFITLIIAMIGFIGCAIASSVAPMVVMLMLTSVGLYGFTGCFFAYLTFFFTESTAPVGIALVNSFAALGGFVGPMILGMFTVSSGMFLLAGLIAVGIFILLTTKRREAEVEAETTA